MDPDELEQLQALSNMFGTGSSAGSTYSPDAVDSTLRQGSMGEFLPTIENQPPGVQQALVREKIALDQQRVTDANIVADAERNIQIIDNLLDTENYQWVGGESNNWLGKWGLASVIPGVTGFGDAQADIEKLKGSIFMSQIPQMKGLGALSNAEGSRIVEAVTALASATPDADGNYKNSMSEEKIKEELDYLRDRFGKIQYRLKAGQRVHPTKLDANGEPLIMSSEQFNAEFPQLANDPTFEAGKEETNQYNYQNSNLTTEELRARIADFKANAPEGAIIVLPDGRSLRKPKAAAPNGG